MDSELSANFRVCKWKAKLLFRPSRKEFRRHSLQLTIHYTEIHISSIDKNKQKGNCYAKYDDTIYQSTHQLTEST
jgi:nitrogen-specific signal transduction histidine kinase